VARRALAAAALAGAASGLRTTVGLASVTRRARPLAWSAVAFELVVDKLPSTPSRLEPRGFVPRVVAGAVVARENAFAGSVVAAAAALAAARIGHDVRTAAPSPAVAVAEDVVALALGAAAARA
jgi:hypothetical protein